MIVRGTTETRDELTGNFGSALEDTSISDYRLIALFAENAERNFWSFATLSPPATDMVRVSGVMECWCSAFPSILLQKPFLGDERNFLGPLMRFVCGDVRDLIVSHKNDHGPAHPRCRALQRWRGLKNLLS